MYVNYGDLQCTMHLFFHRMATRVPKLEITLEGDDRGKATRTAATATSTSFSSDKGQTGSNVRYGILRM